MAPPAADRAVDDVSEDTKHAAEWSVQMLVENGVKDVPSRYIRSKSQYSNLPAIDDFSVKLPVIDYAKMEGENGEEETAKFFKAVDEWGFMLLVNHGFPEGLIDQALGAARGFFHLPLREKQKYIAVDPDCPIEGYGKINNLKGAFDWGDTLMMNGDDTVFSKGKSDFSDWDHLPPKFRDAIVRYGRETHALGLKLVKKMTDALGMADIEETAGPQGSQLFCNLYPPCPQPDLVSGVSEHTDPQTFAFLIQDRPGLHVLNNGRWVLTQYVPNALIVNIGDQLEVVSNGKYKSILHRVKVSSEHERVIVGNFLRPALDAIVGPDPRLIDDQRPPLYKATKFGHYMQEGYAGGFLERRVVNKMRAS